MGAYRDLLKKSDAEVEALYDEAMENTSPRLSLYRDELFRRDGARRDEQMIRYTKEIRSLILTVASATILALLIAVAALVVTR